MFKTISVILIVLVSYFMGCFNGSVITSCFLIHDDVRNHGSGNAGLTNFYRTYGAKYALLVIGCDMLKTVIACLISGYMFRYIFSDWTLGVLVGGLSCELGHIFPVFFGFKGGKGILSGGIIVMMLGLRVALIAWALFLVLACSTRYISLGSIAAAVSLPLSVFFIYHGNLLYTALCVVISVLVIWCHRGNIQRLLRGDEKKFHWHITSTTGQ
ncbi:MAG: glycerol-3-phosphate 1-O-acyltransferase PlsY [Clostridiales bacterium]|nr:glycerol-3-phosphate 1-O-acyltransferase PlsY [Candidatus Cacconaster stercorequi]